MYNEYAIEPKVLTTWSDFRVLDALIDWSKGRLISCYPKKWKRMIYDSLKCTPVERLRIVEKLKDIDICMVRRIDSDYDPSLSWLENALQENNRSAFEKIIAEKNLDDNPCIILGVDVDESTLPVSSGIVKREPDEFALSLKMLLQCSENIILIDPHFRAEEPRFSNVLRKFFEVSEESSYKRKNVQFELHTKIDLGEKLEQHAETRINNMRHYLKDIIPEGAALTVFIWKEKNGGERFHNRYVLSDLGGVTFGTGLDAAYGDETDDITRLNKEQYMHRYNQFKGMEPVFDLVKEAEIKY